MSRPSPNKLSGPDGAEAWTVALAACTINFVMAGLARMSGILYVAFIDIFQVDRRDASLPFSVRSSMRNLFGPVVGILGQKYGARPVVFIGAIIGASSAGICFYAEDIIWITVLWGIFCGIGAALATTLNQAVIGQHFKKYKTTAAGMAFSGGCVGSFIFPVLLEYLLHTFGVQGTFLIISGILMHVIPASLLLRKPKWLSKQKCRVQISTVNDKDKTVSNVEQKKATEKVLTQIAPERNIKVGVVNKAFENDTLQNYTDSKANVVDLVYSKEFEFTREIDKNILWDNRQFIINLFLKNSDEYFQSNKSFSKIYPKESSKIQEVEDLFYQMFEDTSVNDPKVQDKAISTSIDDNFFSKDSQPKNALNLRVSELSNIKKSNLLDVVYITLEKIFKTDMNIVVNTLPEADRESLNKVLNEMHQIYVLLKKYQMKEVGNSSKQSNSFCSHIKTAFKLYTKPIFLLICLCRTIHMMITMPLFTTLVDFSMDKGLPKQDGKYIIGALSLGDLLGRLCLGWISDRGYVTLPKFMMVGMILQGAFLASLSFMYSRATILSGIAICGLLQGCLFVRHPVLVNRYLSSNEQSIAMGCLNFFSGLLSFVMPVYIGYFRDVIGSYNGILYINGAAAAFIGLFWGFEKNIIRLSGKKNVDIEV